MHHKYAVLLQRNEMRLRRLHWLLMELESRQQRLSSEKQTQATQVETLRNLIKHHSFAGVSTRADLFAEQRKLAVLRRQLFAIIQQVQEIDEKLDDIKREIIQHRVLMLTGMYRSEKYKHLLQGALSKKRQTQSRQDESEMEEMILWKK
ncbi:hypothetical protein H2866_16650 [Rouxiella badensis subsp. acadiensis]|nr:hypothetical protein [Rouxiella badensis]QOI54554.1 hypothetical protein H2866_16650 [Rouxiella badensis subsp. acadiensis]